MAQPYEPAIVTISAIIFMNYIYVKRYLLRKVFIDWVWFVALVMIVSFVGLGWVSSAAVVANNDLGSTSSLETLVIVAGMMLSIVANLGLSLYYYDPKFRR